MEYRKNWATDIHFSPVLYLAQYSTLIQNKSEIMIRDEDL